MDPNRSVSISCCFLLLAMVIGQPGCQGSKSVTEVTPKKVEATPKKEETSPKIDEGTGFTKEFTTKDFEQVVKGADEAQVRKILGTPIDTLEVEGVKRQWWKAQGSYYSVSFQEGKVEKTEGPNTREQYEITKGLLEMIKNK